jgi:hypothetical protein
MSSFYGTYNGTSGGTGGTSDYNDLLNKPFTNIVGTSTSPINLSNLDYGNYIIKGSYIYHKNDLNVKSAKILNVEILQDSSSSRKVAKFETIENNTFYIYLIYFNEDGTCLIDRTPIKKSEGVIFIDEENLPTTGSEEVLYITEKTIYQWKDNDYIDMNAPHWGEIL